MTVQPQSLVFDCLTLNMNALGSIEASGAANASTRHCASEDLIHMYGCSISLCCVVDGATAFEWVPHFSTHSNVDLLAQEMSKPRARSEWPFINEF